MKIYLTAPLIPFTKTEQGYLRLWQKRASEVSVVPTLYRQQHAKELHENLLQRVWAHAVANRFEHPKVIFADADFIPEPGALRKIGEDLDLHKFIMVPFFTRDPEKFANCAHHFMPGAWFWAVNFKGALNLPRPDFFATHGRPLDVHCGAYYHFLASNFCTPQEIKIYNGYMDDERLWAIYPSLGVHFFDHRSLGGDLDQVLGEDGRTLRQHVERIHAHIAPLL